MDRGRSQTLTWRSRFIIPQAEEGLDNSGKPGRKELSLFDSADQKVMQIERVGKWIFSICYHCERDCIDHFCTVTLL